MCPRTILGSCTAIRSLHTLGGIPCRGSSWAEWGPDLELASELAFLVDMDGAGTIGDTTGMAGQQSTTTTPTFLTAGRSSIATTSTTAVRPAEAAPAAVVRDSTDLLLLTLSREHARARSADLITAETFEAFPLAGGRALQAVSTEAVFMAAVADATDDGSLSGKAREIKNGEEHHASQDFVFCSAEIQELYSDCNILTVRTFHGLFVCTNLRSG